MTGTLPLLPERSLYDLTGDIKDINTLLVNVNELRAYAAAAVRAERARCIEICEQHATVEGIAQRIAADIRSQHD